MPFKDLPEGTTHSYNDRCGEPSHNQMLQTNNWKEQLRKQFNESYAHIIPQEMIVVVVLWKTSNNN